MNMTTTARTARTRKIRVTERHSLQVVREVAWAFKADPFRIRPEPASPCSGTRTTTATASSCWKKNPRTRRTTCRGAETSRGTGPTRPADQAASRGTRRGTESLVRRAVPGAGEQIMSSATRTHDGKNWMARTLRDPQ